MTLRKLLYTGKYTTCLQIPHISYHASESLLPHPGLRESTTTLSLFALSAKLQPLSHHRSVASLYLFYKVSSDGVSFDELSALVSTRRAYSRLNRQAAKSVSPPLFTLLSASLTVLRSTES